MCSLPLQQLRDLHDQTGTQGEEKTFVLRKDQIDSDVSRSAVAEVVRSCNTCTCNLIDPTPCIGNEAHLMSLRPGRGLRWISRITRDSTT